MYKAFTIQHSNDELRKREPSEGSTWFRDILKLNRYQYQERRVSKFSIGLSDTNNAAILDHKLLPKLTKNEYLQFIIWMKDMLGI